MRFENMWALDDRCTDAIRSDSDCNLGMKVAEQRMTKMDWCMEALFIWDRNLCGHVQSQIQKCTERLKIITSALQRKILLDVNF